MPMLQREECMPGADVTRTIFASQTGAHLNSNVITGGGDDDTAILQAVLDQAPACGGIVLIMDGAALVTGLRLYSNTTILCPNAGCGFYLADGADAALLSNAHPDYEKIHDSNIAVIGGTYNHNCRGQRHHVPPQEVNGASGANGVATDNDTGGRWVVGFSFYGVEGLTVRDIVLRDQRTFAMLIANWRHVTMENIYIDLPHRKDAENQDGIHFWGPGRFLTMRNIRGCSGDDFIALAPDERDLVSSITDVLIDGVMLEEADQGIRLLSRAKGRLDRVIIRNVTGTYKSFGFFICPWFPGHTAGNYGSIVIENVDLRPMEPNYTYRDPFLFQVGGAIESLTLRNITSHSPSHDRTLFELGHPFYDQECRLARTHVGSLLIDGLHLYGHQGVRPLVRLDCAIDVLTIRNVDECLGPATQAEERAPLLCTQAGCNVGLLNLVNLQLERRVIDAAQGKIEQLRQ